MGYQSRDTKPRKLREDRRLLTELTIQPPLRGSIKDLGKLIHAAAQLRVGTTEEELLSARDLFLFKKTRCHEVMEAYALLYRCRWIRYTQGSPAYDLTLGQDAQDSIYGPVTDAQKQRYESMNRFVKYLDQLPPAQQASFFAGSPLKIAELPESIQSTLQGAVDALTSDSSPQPPNRPQRPPVKVNLNDDPNATIGVKDETPKGSSLRELRFSLTTNRFSSTFRWTDYDKSKHSVISARPIAALYPITDDETFSRKAMIERAAFLSAVRAELPLGDWTLKAIFLHLNERYSVRLIAHESMETRKKSYSCPPMKLAELLDQVCLDFGGWEWEAAPESDFLIFRAPNSPRRRPPSS